MKHYDEHTIGLFALNSDKVVSERTEFLKHLDECFSCREAYEEMVEFYKLASGNQRQLNEHVENADSTSLVIKPEYHYARPVVQVPRSIPARAWYYARKRPIVSAFSFLGIMALLTAFINTSVFKKDLNSAYTMPNDSIGKIEIFNKADEKIGALPNKYFYSLREYELNYKNSLTQVVDVDGDGINEIATIIRFGKENKHVRFQIYRTDQKLIVDKPLEPQMEFRGRKFMPTFNPRFILSFNDGKQQAPEFLAGISHINSPFIEA